MTDTLTPPRRSTPDRSDRGALRPSDGTSRRAGTGPDEDPRIRDRRRAVQAEGRRRRRTLVIVAAVLVVLVSAAVAISRSAWFDVDRVVVVGPDAIDHEEVRRASGIDRGDAMVDVDPARARRSVMALPSVSSARVEREWPGTVRVVVRAETPLAVFAGEDRRVVVGRGGRVLSEVGADDPAVEALPTVTVADPSAVPALEVGSALPESLSPVAVMLEQMPEPLRSRIGGVTVADDGGLSISLRGDPAVEGSAGTVQLGPPDELPSKLLAAASMVAGARLDCLDVLDVREPTRPTISRDRGCDPGPPTVGDTTAPTTTAPARSGRTTSSGSARGATTPKTTAPSSARQGTRSGAPG